MGIESFWGILFLWTGMSLEGWGGCCLARDLQSGCLVELSFCSQEKMPRRQTLNSAKASRFLIFQRLQTHEDP